MTHNLKTHHRHWEDIRLGLKTFEVRKDDRGFAEDDTLILHRYPVEKNAYGKEASGTKDCFCNQDDCSRKTERLEVRVTFILPGGQFGIEPGYVVMGIERMEE